MIAAPFVLNTRRIMAAADKRRDEDGPARSGEKLTRGRIADGVDHARETDRELTLWCLEPRGFGCRIRPSGAATFIYQYRARGGRNGPVRRLTIGPTSTFSPEEARLEARRAAQAAALGRDPQREKMAARKALTIAELFEIWRRDEGARLAPKTLANAESHMRRQLKPIATRRLDELSRGELGRLHAALNATPYAANRALSTLSTLYGFAARRDWISPLANPAKGLRRYKERHRERALSPEEIAALWSALIEIQRDAKHYFAAPAIMLGMLTGWRVGEVRMLEWRDVDLVAWEATIRGKTGARRAPLPASTQKLMIWLAETAPHYGLGDAKGRFVLPSLSGRTRERAAITDWEHQRCWTLAVARSGVVNVRRHDLRHLIAGVIGAQTGSALRVKEALGHASITMSERYVAPVSELQRRSTDQAAALVLAFAEGETRAAAAAERLVSAG